jgi:hypothetical protein
MTHGSQEPTHLPTPGAELEVLAYGLQASFHPSIKLERRKGLELAGKLSSALDAREVALGENQWVISQPMGASVNSKFAVTIDESTISIEAALPTDKLEKFDNRAHVILTEFKKMFDPQLLLRSQSMVRATLQIDGDARMFLCSHVTHFDTAKLKPLGRPVHLFGIRFFMPPYEQTSAPPAKPGKSKAKKAAKTAVDWMIDVKAESLIQDPSKLFLEATAEWQTPRPWDKRIVEHVVQGMDTTLDYLRDNLIPTLSGDAKLGDS